MVAVINKVVVEVMKVIAVMKVAAVMKVVEVMKVVAMVVVVVVDGCGVSPIMCSSCDCHKDMTAVWIVS